MKPKLSFNILLEYLGPLTYQNSSLSRYKCWLLHTGDNLNNSHFSKEVVQKALPTLSLIPLVGYVVADGNGGKDFGGHEERLVETPDGVVIKYYGVPFGVVPETNNAKFEDREVDGVTREYLTTEVVSWGGFDGSEILKNKGSVAQSMELTTNYTGEIRDGVFHFTSFEFMRLCALGVDVIPAMVGSTIEELLSTYSKASATPADGKLTNEQISKIYSELYVVKSMLPIGSADRTKVFNALSGVKSLLSGGNGK